MQVQKWPKFAAQKAKGSSFRRKKRKFASLAVAEQRKGRRALDLLKKIYGEKVNVQKWMHVADAVKEFRGMVGNTNGQGYLLIFPMTRSLKTYEFARGVLSVVAPKTRIVALTTPLRSDVFNYAKPKEVEMIDARIKKLLKRDEKQVVIIDDHDTGATCSLISHSLRRNGFGGNILPVQDYFELVGGQKVFLKMKTKTADGRALMNLKQSQKYVDKYPDSKFSTSEIFRIGDSDGTYKRMDNQVKRDRRMLYNLGVASAMDVLEAERIVKK